MSNRIHVLLFLLLVPSAARLPAQDAAPAAGDEWQTSQKGQVTIERAGEKAWKVTSRSSGEFTLESVQALSVPPGDAFAVNLNVRVDLHTKALPELACYDAAGKEIAGRSSMEYGPRYFSTNWQELRRVFPVLPGTASMRARLRCSGKGTVELSELKFERASVEAYDTGAFVTQLHPSLRNGVVLESNFGIVNAEAVSKDDRDGDGKWALVSADLDRLTEPSQKGVDWRSNFEGNPNEILWSDGAVLKSDSVREDRAPSRERALHFRMAGRRGPYQAWMNDPGRAVAWSRDGVKWQRHEAGKEIDLGEFPSTDGVVEFWLDACYRDPITAGPAYFDYVRLYPLDDPQAAQRLFEAARWTKANFTRGSAEERVVEIRVDAPAFAGAQRWPARCGLPIPQGELAAAEQVEVRNAAGKVIPSQCRAMARWPDGSVKWIFLDFFHELSAAEGMYRVAYGHRVQARPEVSGVKIETTAGGLTVDTGAIRFAISSTLR